MTPRPLDSVRILGARVHLVSTSAAIDRMTEWIDQPSGRCRFVVNTGFHGIWEGARDPGFAAILESSDLFTPDGIAPVWISRLRRKRLRERTTGADLMDAFFRRALERGYSCYFYGNTDETLARLTASLHDRYPGLRIVGTFSPPFRPLSEAESKAHVERINAAGPDVLFVGLGLPKQERWIHRHLPELDARVAMGVGACFDFFAGTVKRAPPWVGRCGLEWLWRLSREPRKLWRRCLVDGPRFLCHVALEQSGLRSYRGGARPPRG